MQPNIHWCTLNFCADCAIDDTLIRFFKFFWSKHISVSIFSAEVYEIFYLVTSKLRYLDFYYTDFHKILRLVAS